MWTNQRNWDEGWKKKVEGQKEIEAEWHVKQRLVTSAVAFVNDLHSMRSQLWMKSYVKLLWGISPVFCLFHSATFNSTPDEWARHLINACITHDKLNGWREEMNKRNLIRFKSFAIYRFNSIESVHVYVSGGESENVTDEECAAMIQRFFLPFFCFSFSFPLRVCLLFNWVYENEREMGAQRTTKHVRYKL